MADSQAKLDLVAEASLQIHPKEGHSDSDRVPVQAPRIRRRPGVVADLPAVYLEVRPAADLGPVAAGADGGAKHGLSAQSQ